MKVTVKILRILLGIYLMFFLVRIFYFSPSFNCKLCCDLIRLSFFLLFFIIFSYSVFSCIKKAKILFLEKVIVLITFLLSLLNVGCYP